jgi:uncharacterized protein (DUF2062 family)
MTGSSGASKGNSVLRGLRLAYLRRFPRRRHLHGGFLHRLLGERLFDTRLWKPDRHTFAVGLALGLFVGLMPTYWVQILLSVLLSYVLRVNVGAAVVGTFVTNPFTTIPILGLQVSLGTWLIGRTDPGELEQYHGLLKLVFGHGRQYLLGSVITGALAAAIGYASVLIFWSAGEKVKEARKAKKAGEQG